MVGAGSMVVRPLTKVPARMRTQVEETIEVIRPALHADGGDIVLRDVDEAALRGARLPAVLERRARHVVREIQRVQLGASALRRGDLDVFGLFMAQGHQSLRDDFAVSTRELDAIVDEARAIGAAGGVFGARMTGAGFGGSVIVLADASAAGVGDRIAAGVARRLGRRPSWRRAHAAAGASVIPAARWPGA